MDPPDPQSPQSPQPPTQAPNRPPPPSPVSTALGNSPTDPHPVADALRIAERDADAIVARARQDECSALDLRRRLRTGALATIEPDDRIRDLLGSGEQVIAVRDAAVVERHPTTAAETPRVVRLYVTTTRLVLLGSAPWSIPLDQIDELAVAGEQALVTLVDGQGICLDAGSPRLLRVQIAAVRAGLRT